MSTPSATRATSCDPRPQNLDNSSCLIKFFFLSILAACPVRLRTNSQVRSCQNFFLPIKNPSFCHYTPTRLPRQPVGPSASTWARWNRLEQPELTSQTAVGRGGMRGRPEAFVRAGAMRVGGSRARVGNINSQIGPTLRNACGRQGPAVGGAWRRAAR